jgi:hypothetical protein
VRGEFGIRLVDFGVVEVGLVDTGAQVVGHKALGDAAEELEGFDVGLDPGALVEVDDRADEHVPRAGQDHAEEAVVDLCLQTGLDLVA